MEQDLREWNEWLSERPIAVRKVAEKIVPWKKYVQKEIDSDLGNYYIPTSYDVEKDGRVTLTCNKYNDSLPGLGGYGVFGMNPDDLVEIENE